MSKIFRISGRYDESRSSFSAKIAVDSMGTFCSRCGFVIDSNGFSLTPHFIVGVMAEREIKGLAFYMLPNDVGIAPVEFLVPNIEYVGKCRIGVLDFGGISESEAKITLKEMTSDLVGEEADIRSGFSDINKSLYSDERILEMEQRLRLNLEKAQAEYRRERGD